MTSSEPILPLFRRRTPLPSGALRFRSKRTHRIQLKRKPIQAIPMIRPISSGSTNGETSKFFSPTRFFAKENPLLDQKHEEEKLLFELIPFAFPTHIIFSCFAWKRSGCEFTSVFFSMALTRKLVLGPIW